MTQKPAQPTREERLAAKLRENLRRRKAQARALDQQDGAANSVGETDGENAALSKGHGKS